MQQEKIELNNRPQLFIIALICFASLAYAFYLQESQNLSPCLMCIVARYIILATGIISLFAFQLTFIKNKIAHIFAKTLHILNYPVIFAGIYYVYQHYTIIKSQSTSCMINPLQKILNDLPTKQFFPEFFEVRGSCSNLETMLHGIPIYFTPLIVYALFFFFSYLYFNYDNYMLVKKFNSSD